MNNDSADYLTQKKLVTALLDSGCYPHTVKAVHLIETHISWVLLAGRYAYKIKKPLDLDFLNFTTLETRRFYCNEEVRLNRRLAPKIYLDVVSIGGNSVTPEFGIQPALEYAVRMRRFAVAKQMDRLLVRNKVLSCHMDSLAAILVRFHGSLPAAEADSVFGSGSGIRLAAMQNYEQLNIFMRESADREIVGKLREATAIAFTACAKYFKERHVQGYVRECHGDLHLGNIVLIGNEPVPFDGIEFSPALRWIDVMSEIAFPVMDLLHRKRHELAYRFLNAYLEGAGDYGGLSVLRFYVAYRAAVRAKISAIRASQPDMPRRDKKIALAACRSYLALAGTSLAQHRAVLIITHGLPGSGKTTFAQVALERLQAIRIRSDVERKRLFGLAPLADSSSQIGSGMYSADATRRTYARLLELARELLVAGFSVIVDAAFLRREERRNFIELARSLNTPFAIASLQASKATLNVRIKQRQMETRDASEAGIAVLKMLHAAQEPLLQQEQACTVEFNNDECVSSDINAPSWRKLDKLQAFPA